MILILLHSRFWSFFIPSHLELRIWFHIPSFSDLSLYIHFSSNAILEVLRSLTPSPSYIVQEDLFNFPTISPRATKKIRLNFFLLQSLQRDIYKWWNDLIYIYIYIKLQLICSRVMLEPFSLQKWRERKKTLSCLMIIKERENKHATRW